jgi:hypothetical protein
MSANQKRDPFSGTWAFVPGESKWPGSMRTYWIQEIICAGDRVHVTERIVTASDELLTHHIDAAFDGREYVVAGSALAETIAYTRRSPSCIEGIARKAGRIIFREAVSLSTNGDRMVQTVSFATANGQPLQGTAVFHRDVTRIVQR